MSNQEVVVLHRDCPVRHDVQHVPNVDAQEGAVIKEEKCPEFRHQVRIHAGA